MTVLDKLFRSCEVIGKGAYGVVYSGQDEEGDYAFKRRYALYNEELKGIAFLAEIYMSAIWRHPNLLNAESVQWKNPDMMSSINIDTVMDRDPTGQKEGSYRADPGYIITKRAKCDLRKLIDDPSSKFDEDTIIKYMHDIISGIAYIHRSGFIHRDIKPENILVFDDGLKVCDFDMVIPAARAQGPLAMTPAFIPPEVLLQGDHIHYDQCNDVWGAGLILISLIAKKCVTLLIPEIGTEKGYQYLLRFYELFTGKSIKDALPTDKDPTLLTICSSININVSERLRPLVNALLEVDVTKRLPMHKILQMEIFKDYEYDESLIIPDKVGGMQFFFNHEIDPITELSKETKAYVYKYYRKMMDAKPSLTWLNGFFLGLDILSRVDGRIRDDDGSIMPMDNDMVTIILNMGIKFYTKDTFPSHNYPNISHKDVTAIEYKILDVIGFCVYRSLLIEYMPEKGDLILETLLETKHTPNILFTDLLFKLKEESD